jgi:hypothetical protein
MKFQQHAVVSITLSGILYMLFRSWGLSTGCLLSGILIDLDYAIDYIWQCGMPFRIQEFFQSYREERLRKVRLFHGWEWVVFWFFTAWLTGWNDWVVGLLIGFGHHLLLDKMNFGEPFLSYSLLWRWKKGFKSEELFRKSAGAKKGK